MAAWTSHSLRAPSVYLLFRHEHQQTTLGGFLHFPTWHRLQRRFVVEIFYKVAFCTKSLPWKIVERVLAGMHSAASTSHFCVLMPARIISAFLFRVSTFLFFLGDSATQMREKVCRVSDNLACTQTASACPCARDGTRLVKTQSKVNRRCNQEKRQCALIEEHPERATR